MKEGREKYVPPGAREPSKKTIVEELDLTKAFDTENEAEIIEERIDQLIKGLGLDRNDLILRGFDGTPQKINNLLKHGNDIPGGKMFFAGGIEGMHDPYESAYGNPLRYADQQKNPAIAVYDPNKVESGEKYYEYVLKPDAKGPEAVLAIFKLKLAGS